MREGFLLVIAIMSLHLMVYCETIISNGNFVLSNLINDSTILLPIFFSIVTSTGIELPTVIHLGRIGAPSKESKSTGGKYTILILHY